MYVLHGVRAPHGRGILNLRSGAGGGGHKRPYKARFIANSSSCTTTELSKLLTSCLTAVKNHVIRYCEKVYERSGKNLFWSIRFGTKLYRQIVGIPMGTNCAPLVVDLFLFCYERDFMTSLSDVKQAEIIEAFKSTSRYLDDLLNIDNPYFEGMVNRIYPPELQLNKANTSDTEAPFLDLHLSISNGFVSSKIYDKRDDFEFDIVNFPFLDGDVPRSTSYGV